MNFTVIPDFVVNYHFTRDDKKPLQPGSGLNGFRNSPVGRGSWYQGVIADVFPDGKSGQITSLGEPEQKKSHSGKKISTDPFFCARKFSGSPWLIQRSSHAGV
jgi:hypothetical protein